MTELTFTGRTAPFVSTTARESPKAHLTHQTPPVGLAVVSAANTAGFNKESSASAFCESVMVLPASPFTLSLVAPRTAKSEADTPDVGTFSTIVDPAADSETGTLVAVGGRSVAMYVVVAEAFAELTATESEDGRAEELTGEDSTEPEMMVDVGAGAEVTVTRTVLTTTEVETVTEVDCATLVDMVKDTDTDCVDNGRSGWDIEELAVADPVWGIEEEKLELGIVDTVEEGSGASEEAEDGTAEEDEGIEEEDKGVDADWPPGAALEPPRLGVGTEVELGLGAGRP